MTRSSNSDRGRLGVVGYGGRNTNDYVEAINDLPQQRIQAGRGKRLADYYCYHQLCVLYMCATSNVALADRALEEANAHREKPFGRAELALAFGYLANRPEQDGKDVPARRAAQKQASEDSIVLRALEHEGAGASDAVTFLMERGGIDGLKQRYRDRQKAHHPELTSGGMADFFDGAAPVQTSEGSVDGKPSSQKATITQAAAYVSDERFDDDMGGSTEALFAGIGDQRFQEDDLIAHWTEEVALAFHDLPEGIIGIWCKKLKPNHLGRAPVVVLEVIKLNINKAPETVKLLNSLEVTVPGHD